MQPPLEQIGDRYLLVRRLATGGMADVMLAYDAGRRVAIKRMLPHLARDPEFVAMFVEEARLGQLLQHPNIVRVKDVAAVETELYFMMEYVAGPNLLRLLHRARRREGGIPLPFAIAIILGAATGLDYAHDKTDTQGEPLGVVHRDVSLSNVMVGYDGRVKLSDFGVARINTTPRTGDRVVKGKIGYMSPEQCMGRPLDRRSDVFALGILLYELTTGRKLLRGATDYEVMRQTLRCELTRPTQVCPEYHPELEAIVMKALARRPDDRFATAQALQMALARFVSRARLATTRRALSQFVCRLFAPSHRPDLEQTPPRPRRWAIGTGP